MRKFIFIGFNIAIMLRNRTPIRALGLHTFNQKLSLSERKLWNFSEIQEMFAHNFAAV